MRQNATIGEDVPGLSGLAFADFQIAHGADVAGQARSNTACYNNKYCYFLTFAMNVSLTAELEQYVQTKVESGMYHSASEVIREALRLLKDQDSLQEVQREALRQELRRGIEQADAGKFSKRSITDLKAEARRRKTQK
jgi:antitoxin ParD1/3/4